MISTGTGDRGPREPGRSLLARASRHWRKPRVRFQLRRQAVVARTGDDLETAFSSMARARPGRSRARLRALPGREAARGRVGHCAPAADVFHLKGPRGGGGLMSCAADVSDLFRRGASNADKMLRRAKPSDLLFEQAWKFEVVINLKTPKALRLPLPAALLPRPEP